MIVAVINKLKDTVDIMQDTFDNGLDIKLMVEIKGYPKLERIIVPHDNIPQKIEYIAEVYSDELEHLYADVKIVGIKQIEIDNFLEKFLKGEDK